MITFLQKHRKISLTLTILMAIEIFYFSSLSFAPSGGGNPWISRIYHFTVFFLFNFFLLTTIKSTKKLTIKQITIALTISILYSISDEIHQIFVPFRDASFKDIMTNSLGIFTSTLLNIHINKKIKK